MAKNLELNDSVNGIVYGFAAGMEFAWVENFYIAYVYEGDPFASLLRILIFSLGHGVYTAFTGRILGAAKVKRGHVKIGGMSIGLVPAMLTHGLYNSFLISIFDLPELKSLVIWLPVTDDFFILLLYYYVKKAWKKERLQLYDRGLAPTGKK